MEPTKAKLFTKICNSLAYGKLRVILSHWLVTSALGLATIVYFGVLDFFGDLPWVKSYYGWHLLGFVSIVVAQWLITILRTVGEKIRERNPVVSDKCLPMLSRSVAMIISAKTHRFREAMLKLGQQKSPFDVITRPDEQIDIILIEAGRYFVDLLGIDEDRFDITILRPQEGTESWMFRFYLRKNFGGRADRQPETLLSALTAHSTGNELFLPSKKHGEIQAQYTWGQRDEQFGGDGSIFSKPIKVSAPDRTDEYLVTFVTYGTTVCSLHDEDASKAWRTLFGEFARRIEVELILLSMKEYVSRRSVQNKLHRAQGKKCND